MNINHQTIADGYLEALRFTECHSDNPEMQGGDFSPELIEHADREARAIIDAFGLSLLKGTAAGGEQIGHDLWFTRNGHGVGFWDREDIYGPITAEHLTLYAQACGEVWPYVGDDGLIYID